MSGVSIARGVTATDTVFSTSPPQPVPATGSPFIYTNNNSLATNVIINGGTVSLIEFSRDGVTYFPVGLIAGMFRLNPGDRLRITYLTAPTITQILL